MITLGAWCRANRGFVIGTNEAGMRLAGATRAADAALWRRADLGARTRGLRHHAPVLAVEVVGEDDGEAYLREKARWYLDVGVEVVWIVVPERRELLVITPGSESRLHRDARVPPHPSLPGLTPAVRDLFVQLDES